MWRIPEAAVFRVPSRSASQGVAAIPRPPYDARRRMVGVMHGRNGWSLNGPARTSIGTPKATAEPAFRAPWGELEQQIPYVTITTRPFPLEWWHPRPAFDSAIARASAMPMDSVTPAAPVVQRDLMPLFEIRQPAPAAAPGVRRAIDQEASFGQPSAYRADDRQARPATQAKGRRRRRRGLAARLAVVALGLLISLLAVESATRRRP